MARNSPSPEMLNARGKFLGTKRLPTLLNWKYLPDCKKGMELVDKHTHRCSCPLEDDSLASGASQQRRPTQYLACHPEEMFV